MPTTNNAVVADLLRRYAAVLDFERDSRFKSKAYRRAAETIEFLEDNVADLVARRVDLKQLPGIGAGISRVIEDIVAKGSFGRLDEATSQLQPEVMELATRPGLDAKRIQRIYKKLGIHNLEQLQQALDAGTIKDKFGARMHFHVRHGLDNRPRMLLQRAELLAEKFEAFLATLPNVSHVSRTGSLRRKAETVGDLNFLVASKSASAIFERLSKFGGGAVSQTKNSSTASLQLSGANPVTITWTPPMHWGLALIQHTGSADHLEDLQKIAAQKNIKLTPAALAKQGISTADEEAVYQGLGMEFIEPELREGRGEVQAAASGSLPQLIREQDLQGDLHMHTTASDGINTLAEMAAAAQARGYRYIAITDHSQSLRITNGLTEKRLLQSIREIDQLNSQLSNFTVLKSAEVDILEDGRLDYSDAVLKELDLTICSIHSKFALDKEQQTARVLRAMDNRYFTILGHATGRLLLKREGYELDLEKIFEHARERGVFFEINSSPDRLDLSDIHAKRAKEFGIPIAINTDAHSTDELDLISRGVIQARRAWLEPADVLNTRTLSQLRRKLRR